MKFTLLASFAVFVAAAFAVAAPVTTVEALTAAVAEAKGGAVIELAEGTFKLTQPLDLKTGIALKGAGVGKTVITSAESWSANPATLPDPETDFRKFDRTGYLIRCPDKAADITISHLTLTGPRMHGAIFGFGNVALHLHDLRVQDFMYCGVRTFDMQRAKIHDCTFVDAGQRWEKGQPGVKGGITGGAIFAIWMKDSEIWNNRFLVTKTAPNEHFYGVKVREGRRCRIHHNTIEAGFSIEMPFENDEDVEIDHNILHSAVSIPKHAGGAVPKSGRTFHIHHNYFRDTYSIEFVRNGVEISHNLFDFDVAKDGGNLMAAFGKAPARGPASFQSGSRRDLDERALRKPRSAEQPHHRPHHRQAAHRRAVRFQREVGVRDVPFRRQHHRVRRHAAPALPQRRERRGGRGKQPAHERDRHRALQERRDRQAAGP
jgi:hypothetical protein